ncbi:unnamed protein product [Protopolystoma xenopodis]|uniref:Uncharacterized protein n=1 Tax=Protopolystoma xenopodis TaxID=117903 RepID=A0A3S5CNZ3_9PLAT|nr:unnamed protein product [Protopolystoma xenopodis]
MLGRNQRKYGSSVTSATFKLSNKPLKYESSIILPASGTKKSMNLSQSFSGNSDKKAVNHPSFYFNEDDLESFSQTTVQNPPKRRSTISLGTGRLFKTPSLAGGPELGLSSCRPSSALSDKNFPVSISKDECSPGRYTVLRTVELQKGHSKSPYMTPGLAIGKEDNHLVRPSIENLNTPCQSKFSCYLLGISDGNTSDHVSGRSLSYIVFM